MSIRAVYENGVFKPLESVLWDWSLSIVTGMELVAGAMNKDEIRESTSLSQHTRPFR